MEATVSVIVAPLLVNRQLEHVPPAWGHQAAAVLFQWGNSQARTSL